MQDGVWRTRFETAKKYGKQLYRLRWLRLHMTQQALSDAIGGQVSPSRMSEIETNRTPKVLFGPERHAALSTYFVQRLGADDADVVWFNDLYDAMFFAFEGEGEDGGVPVSPHVATPTNTERTSAIGSAPRGDDETVPPPQEPSLSVPGQPTAEYGPSVPRLLTASPESAAAVVPDTEREGPSKLPSRGEAVMRRGTPSATVQPHRLTAPRGGRDSGRGRRARIGIPLLLGALSFVLVAAILVGGRLWLVPRLVHQATNTTVPITLSGELLAVVQVGLHGGGLGLVDPASARVNSLLLAPDAQTGVQRYLAPAYTAIAGRLAYIGETATGRRGLWIVHVLMAPGSASAVQVAPPGPTRVLVDCGSCNTLTWSADGQWLFYDSPSGLVAFNPSSGTTHRLTQGAHDAWPACSPDGRWLAYQHAVETLGQLVIVSARACFPLTGAAAQMLVVSSYLVAWHPAWDRQGDRLAFIGTSSVGQRIYTVDVSSFAHGKTSSANAGRLVPQPVSTAGCAEPVWIPQPHRATDLLVYVCRVQAVQRLLAVPAVSPTASQPEAISGASNDQPTLFNPVWLPFPSA